MNFTELEAVRRHLFFSVAEAARMVSGTSERAWRMWESGQRHVPEDVAATLRQLVEWREIALANMEQAIAEATERAGHPPDDLVLVWYSSLDDWLTKEDEPMFWRPHCSAVAEIAAGYDARLVCFDLEQYRAWLGSRADSESARAAWAGSTRA